MDSYRAAILYEGTTTPIYSTHWEQTLPPAKLSFDVYRFWLDRNPGVKGRAVIQKKYEVIEEIEVN